MTKGRRLCTNLEQDLQKKMILVLSFKFQKLPKLPENLSNFGKLPKLPNMYSNYQNTKKCLLYKWRKVTRHLCVQNVDQNFRINNH